MDHYTGFGSSLITVPLRVSVPAAKVLTDAVALPLLLGYLGGGFSALLPRWSVALLLMFSGLALMRRFVA